MILCVHTESEAEVEEDVLWNIKLPSIHRAGLAEGLTGPRQNWQNWKACYWPLPHLSLLPYFPQHFLWVPCLLLIDVSPLCFYLLIHMPVKHRIQSTGRFYLGYRGNRLLSKSHRPTDIKLAPSHWVEQQFRGRDTSPNKTRKWVQEGEPFLSLSHCSVALRNKQAS